MLGGFGINAPVRTDGNDTDREYTPDSSSSSSSCFELSAVIIQDLNYALTMRCSLVIISHWILPLQAVVELCVCVVWKENCFQLTAIYDVWSIPCS